MGTSVKLKMRPRQPAMLTAWCRCDSMIFWQWGSGHSSSVTLCVTLPTASLQHVTFGFCSHGFIWHRAATMSLVIFHTDIRSFKHRFETLAMVVISLACAIQLQSIKKVKTGRS